MAWIVARKPNHEPKRTPTRAKSVAKMRERMSTVEGRREIMARCATELLAGASNARSLALATVLRAVKLARDEENAQEEIVRLRDLSDQLAADRQERSSMESGVQFTHEAPQLDPTRSGDQN